MSNALIVDVTFVKKIEYANPYHDDVRPFSFHSSCNLCNGTEKNPQEVSPFK